MDKKRFGLLMGIAALGLCSCSGVVPETSAAETEGTDTGNYWTEAEIALMDEYLGGHYLPYFDASFYGLEYTLTGIEKIGMLDYEVEGATLEVVDAYVETLETVYEDVTEDYYGLVDCYRYLTVEFDDRWLIEIVVDFIADEVDEIEDTGADGETDSAEDDVEDGETDSREEDEEAIRSAYSGEEGEQEVSAEEVDGADEIEDTDDAEEPEDTDDAEEPEDAEDAEEPEDAEDIEDADDAEEAITEEEVTGTLVASIAPYPAHESWESAAAEIDTIFELYLSDRTTITSLPEPSEDLDNGLVYRVTCYYDISEDGEIVYYIEIMVFGNFMAYADDLLEAGYEVTNDIFLNFSPTYVSEDGSLYATFLYDEEADVTYLEIVPKSFLTE